MALNLLHGNAVTSLILLASVWICYKAYSAAQLNARRRAFQLKHGCEPSTAYYPLPPWDLLGVKFMQNIVPRVKKHEMLQCFHEQHLKYGKNYILDPPLGRTTIFSNDPENTKCMMATKFDDWLSKDARQAGVGQLLGDGIFTTDGAFWAHSRALIRPQFEKSQVSEQVDQFEAYLPKLLAKIPEGETVDLQDLFHRLAMDTATEFLTGTSTNSLDDDAQGEAARKFIEAFNLAMYDVGWRLRLGWLYWLRPDFKALRATKYVRGYVGKWVEAAVEYRDSVAAGQQDEKRDGPYVFINELAKQKEVDVDRIRNETINVLLAGRDTTATLLSHLWFMLARRPDVWKKLQAEVDQLEGRLPTYGQLKEMTYMRDCCRETLRLFPPLPTYRKRAARDTVLPRGGGPNGDKPLFVAKDSAFQPVFWSLQRDPDVFGPDPDNFRPERWEDPSLRPYWSYIPFGGGPRVCLGQQYALSETYYVTARLMQHFRHVEARRLDDWKGKVAVTLTVANGVQVALSNGPRDQ